MGQVKDYLVVTRRRGFWDSRAFFRSFSLRLLLRSKPNIIEEVVFGILGVFFLFLYKPRVLILGTSTKIVFWYAKLRHWGFLKKIKFVTDAQYLSSAVAQEFDRIIVYSRGEINQYPESLRPHFVFLPYPSKIEEVSEQTLASGEYIFCGGNNDRDHQSFIEAVKGLPVKVIIVTDQKLPEILPENCQFFPHLPLSDYMGLMAKSLFVVVPLNRSTLPHGHCDISSALGLGKVVVSTAEASVEDYILPEQNGFLVAPNDVVGYRQVISNLLNNRTVLISMEENVKRGAYDLSYEAFAEKLKHL